MDCHNCLLWLIPAIDKFPKSRRFTLGDKIENNLLQVLTLLIEATYLKSENSLHKRMHLLV